MAALLMAGCEKVVDWELKDTDYEMPLIVDGIITNQLVQHEIQLSRPVTEFGSSGEPVSGAAVVVRFAGVSFPFYEDDDTLGLYRCDTGLVANVDRKYVLEIDHDGKLYTAVTGVRAVFTTGLSGEADIARESADVDWKWIWTNAQYFYRPAMFQAHLDWSHVSGYEDAPADSTHAILTTYNLTTVDVSQLIQPPKEEVRFPTGTKVTLKKFSLTPSYEEYIRALLIETDWRGMGFDTPPGNLPTNISGNAAGFFTACSVVEATGYVQEDGTVTETP